LVHHRALVSWLRPSRALHSLPTRRSSDLRERAAGSVPARGIGPAVEQAARAAHRVGVLIVLVAVVIAVVVAAAVIGRRRRDPAGDRKSTRLNSSHVSISYAVFCLKKKKDQ